MYCRQQELQCVSVETPNHALSPFRLLLSSRGWAEAEPKLCAIIEILVFVWRLTEIPAFRLQLSGRKPEEHHITCTLNFLNKYTGRIYSSCSLPDSCNGNAGISSSLQTKIRISIPAQSFGSCSASTPTQQSSLVKTKSLNFHLRPDLTAWDRFFRWR